jgi:hypothetical protein
MDPSIIALMAGQSVHLSVAIAAPLLPAGTVLHVMGIDDNTAANRRNPDPNMWVGFGERSVDDMLQVQVNIVHLDDAEFQRLADERTVKPAPTSRVPNR